MDRWGKATPRSPITRSYASGDGSTRALSFTDDGRQLLSSGKDGQLFVVWMLITNYPITAEIFAHGGGSNKQSARN